MPAFQRPQQPQDEWVARKYHEFGLGDAPSLADVEPKATELLGDIRTALTGAELVLGRRVDGNPDKEPNVLPIVAAFNLSAEEKFCLLLLQKEMETWQSESTG